MVAVAVCEGGDSPPTSGIDHGIDGYRSVSASLLECVPSESGGYIYLGCSPQMFAQILRPPFRSGSCSSVSFYRQKLWLWDEGRRKKR